MSNKQNDTWNEACEEARQEAENAARKLERDYVKSLLRNEIWGRHILTKDFVANYEIKTELAEAINELCLKSHNETLEKLLKIL